MFTHPSSGSSLLSFSSYLIYETNSNEAATAL